MIKEGRQVKLNATGVKEFSGVLIENQQLIMQKTKAIIPHVNRWLEPYSAVIQTNRVDSTCLGCVSMCVDRYPAEVLTHISVFSLILFAIDDFADSTSTAFSPFERKAVLKTFAELVVATTNQSSHAVIQSIDTSEIAKNIAWQPIARALVNCFCQMQAFPNFSPDYYAFLVKRFGLLIQAMAKEVDWTHEYTENKTYPTYKTYIDIGQESVASPSVLAGLMAMFGTDLKPLTPELEQQMDHLVLLSGVNIRLANDIRSLDRERREGKPNSVFIDMLDTHCDEQVAKERALVAIATCKVQMYGAVAKLPPEFEDWAQCVVDLTLFSVDFYLHCEFHDFGLENYQWSTTGFIKKEKVA